MELIAHLSSLSGSKILYASNALRLHFRTSALASVAVVRMTASMSSARETVSRSGGLKQFMHASTSSVAMSLRESDLSDTELRKCGRRSGDWTCSTMAMRHAFDLETKTLLDLAQPCNRFGTKNEINGSNALLRHVARVVTSSAACPDRRDRSDSNALLMGRASSFTEDTNSGKRFGDVPFVIASRY